MRNRCSPAALLELQPAAELIYEQIEGSLDEACPEAIAASCKVREEVSQWQAWAACHSMHLGGTSWRGPSDCSAAVHL